VLGTAETTLPVPLAITVAEVLELLICQYPQLARWRTVTRFAVNEQFVPAATALQPGDELAFIPPVSGG